VVDVAVIQVPAGVHVTVPLQVLFVSSVGSVPTASYPRMLVNIGDGASLNLKQSYASVKIDTTSSDEEVAVIADEVAGVDNVGEGGASLAVEVEDTKSVPTLVTANTRILLGRGGSKIKHTYTQESAGQSISQVVNIIETKCFCNGSLF
jgi:Fe-S cluster assembly scaffold protein SufB